MSTLSLHRSETWSVVLTLDTNSRWFFICFLTIIRSLHMPISPSWPTLSTTVMVLRSITSWERRSWESLNVFQELPSTEPMTISVIINNHIRINNRPDHCLGKWLEQCVPHLCPHPSVRGYQEQGYQTILGWNLLFRKETRHQSMSNSKIK